MGFRSRIAGIGTSSVILIVLAGCASEQKPMRVEPAVLSQSYDYTKPVDATGKSRPVYILPTINYGWNPARTNESNEWVGGHYTATVVAEGHWATLEEAELAGKPYIFAGESAPVVPIPHREGDFAASTAPGENPVGPTGGGPSEINLSTLASRVKKLEVDQPKLRTQADTDSFLMATVTQHGVDARDGGSLTPVGAPIVEVAALPADPSRQAAPPPDNSVEIRQPVPPAPTPAPAPDSVARGVEMSSPPPATAPASASMIVIQPRPMGSEETYEVPGSKEPLFVDYGANGMVTMTYKGVSRDAQFSSERREINFTLPNGNSSDSTTLTSNPSKTR